MATPQPSWSTVWKRYAAVLPLRRSRAMIRDDELFSLLSQFPSTLLTDFPIQGILQRLVEMIVETLPVTAVGITLISPTSTPHFIAASNDDALRFEHLQTDTGQGPCMLAYESGVAVTVPHMQHELRFPEFAAAAAGAGLAAAFAFPLRHKNYRLGALDLYRDRPGGLDDADLAAGQTLADIAAAYILNAQARADARATAERFRSSSMHDSLTGLPNRMLLEQRLEHAARRAERSHSNAAVLFADLDRFKLVNDTYGHQVGDDVLVAVAHRLSALVRPGDTLARISGDEFVFLCEDLSKADDIEILAVRINEALAVPFTISGVELTISASVGMAYAGPGEAISNQLIVNADIAMYQAKRRGGASHQIIDLRTARRAGDRRPLEQDLQTAIDKQELTLAYQPIVNTRDGSVDGVEALLRWTHPARGPIPALEMIRTAEDNGLIDQIGSWVLQEACTAHGRWTTDRDHRPLDLSINVSVRQLLGPRFGPTVAAVLERTGIDPGCLILEVTEGIFIQNADRALAVLGELKSLGVRLALDDFGTGYSSLSYLRQFPVDILKIDRSFITPMASEPAARSIVASVTDLAHALGLGVIAEGVETWAQRDQIIAVGCAQAQGYLFSPGLPEAALVTLLRSERPGRLRLPRPTSALAG